MESSLHQQLKRWYAQPGDELEVKVGSFRIDIANSRRLTEIQQAGLGALRDKATRLLRRSSELLIVKPIPLSKQIVVCSRGLKVIRRRRSPKRGSPLDFFDELIHFCRVFPHDRLTIELALVEIEEWRTIQRRRRTRKGYDVRDRKLVAVHERLQLRTATDLLDLLPARLPQSFDTKALAELLDVPRWRAQQIAYCLRHCGAVQATGRRGNAWQYSPTRSTQPNRNRLHCA